jgi:hypothetical protein
MRVEKTIGEQNEFSLKAKPVLEVDFTQSIDVVNKQLTDMAKSLTHYSSLKVCELEKGE